MAALNEMSPLVRAALFRRAKTLIEKVCERLSDAKSFLEQENEAGVFGSLEGLESDMLTLNCLMLICQDFNQKEHYV